MNRKRESGGRECERECETEGHVWSPREEEEMKRGGENERDGKKERLTFLDDDNEEGGLP